jgi:hypothetical protein
MTNPGRLSGVVQAGCDKLGGDAPHSGKLVPTQRHVASANKGASLTGGARPAQWRWPRAAPRRRPRRARAARRPPAGAPRARARRPRAAARGRARGGAARPPAHCTAARRWRRLPAAWTAAPPPRLARGLGLGFRFRARERVRQPQGLHATTATGRRAHQSGRQCQRDHLAASGLRGQAGERRCRRSGRWRRRAPNARWRRQISAYRPPPKALALAQGSCHSSSASAASAGTAAGSAACAPALSAWPAASLGRRLCADATRAAHAPRPADDPFLKGSLDVGKP